MLNHRDRTESRRRTDQFFFLSLVSTLTIFFFFTKPSGSGQVIGPDLAQDNAAERRGVRRFSWDAVLSLSNFVLSRLLAIYVSFERCQNPPQFSRLYLYIIPPSLLGRNTFLLERWAFNTPPPPPRPPHHHHHRQHQHHFRHSQLLQLCRRSCRQPATIYGIRDCTNSSPPSDH